MKFLEEQEKIQYFGIELCIPADTKYIATDESGYVWSYTIKPHKEEDQWFTMYGRSTEICKVDLEGMNWEETLVCI